MPGPDPGGVSGRDHRDSDGQRFFQRRNGGDAGRSGGRIHDFGAFRAIRAIEASGAGTQGVVASHGRREIEILPGFLFGRARKTEDEVARTEKALAEARASLRQSCVNIKLPAPAGVDIARFSWVEPSPPVS